MTPLTMLDVAVKPMTALSEFRVSVKAAPTAPANVTCAEKVTVRLVTRERCAVPSLTTVATGGWILKGADIRGCSESTEEPDGATLIAR